MGEEKAIPRFCSVHDYSDRLLVVRLRGRSAFPGFRSTFGAMRTAEGTRQRHLEGRPKTRGDVVNSKMPCILASIGGIAMLGAAVCTAQESADPPEEPSLQDDLLSIPSCPHPAPMKCPVPKGTPLKQYCCRVYQGGTLVDCVCGVDWVRDWRRALREACPKGTAHQCHQGANGKVSGCF
jgi:hypothetical protein